MITVFLFFVSYNVFRIIFILAFGIFLSIGQLAFLTYFWNLTMPEERGRIGGIIGFVSFLLYFIVGPLVAGNLDFLGITMLSIILSLGPLTVILLRPEKAVLTIKKDEKGNYPEKRTLLSYSIPWVLFSLNNVTLAKGISLNISQLVPSSLYLSLTFLQTIGVLFGTLSGGVIADFFGRRVSLAFSLTLYGISSALAGLANIKEILYLVYIVNGLSWGVLLIMYTFVVWGDLANKENCTKIYSIGLITFYLTTGLGLLMQTSQISLTLSSLASCLLIFLSNIPISLAPELLPSDFRERIKLKLHMSAVKKIKRSRSQG